MLAFPLYLPWLFETIVQKRFLRSHSYGRREAFALLCEIIVHAHKLCAAPDTSIWDSKAQPYPFAAQFYKLAIQELRLRCWDTSDSICAFSLSLMHDFPGGNVLALDIVAAVRTLIGERFQAYHASNGYSVAPPHLDLVHIRAVCSLCCLPIANAIPSSATPTQAKEAVLPTLAETNKLCQQRPVSFGICVTWIYITSPCVAVCCCVY